MKNLFFVLFFSFLISPAYAYSSIASKFAESEYKKFNNCPKIYINMKKELCNEYNLKTGGYVITKVVYGWGDLKIQRCKKQKITYIVLFNECCKPFWSDIIFYK